MDLRDKGVIDNGCSRHMTGNMSYLTDYEEIDGGYVIFRGNLKGGKTTGKDSTLIDESQVLLRVPRKNNMCSVDLKNIVPKGGSGPDWLFDIDALTRTMNNELIVAGTQSNDFIDLKCSRDDGFQPSSDHEKKVDEDPRHASECIDQEKEDNVDNTNNVNENIPNVVGGGPDWLSDIDVVTRPMNNESIAAGTQSNDFTDQEKEYNVDSTNNVNVTDINEVNTISENISNELPFDLEMPELEDISTFNFSSDLEDNDEMADMNNLDTTIQVIHVPTIGIHKDHPLDQELCIAFKKMMYEKFQMRSLGELTFFLGLQVKQKQDGIFINQDKYVAEILKKYGFTKVKNASTLMETQKPLLKGEDCKEVDVHMYRSMIGSLMYLTSSRPDIMFVAKESIKVSDPQVVSEPDYKRGLASVEEQLVHYQTNKSLLNEKIAVLKRDLSYKDFKIVVLKSKLDKISKEKDDLDVKIGKFENACQSLDKLIGSKTTDNSKKGLRYESDGEDEVESPPEIERKTVTSSVDKFWTTAKAKSINGEAHIHAKVDGKKNEFSSPNASAIICLAINQKFNFSKWIFKSMDRNLDNESRNILMYPRFIQVFLDKQLDGISNHERKYVALSHTKNNFRNMRRKPKRKVGKVPQHSDPIEHVAYEAIYKELDDRLMRAATIASSLEAEQDSGGGPRCQDTMGDTIAQTRVKSFDDNEDLGEDASKQGRKIDEINADEGITLVDEIVENQGSAAAIMTVVEVTLAQALMEIKSTKPKAKAIVLQEPSESRITITISLKKSRDKEESSKKAEAEVMEGSSKRAGIELEHESSKKQKINDNKETAELTQLAKIIPGEEGVEFNAIPLVVKPPSIVDWKIHKEGKKSYYQKIKADESSKIYLFFSHMLKSFDREDVETLWKLIKAKHGSTRPEEGYEKVL
nr:uncharacterized mitochondrial protein AtMg00810-like [Tanacetum cinerariifolium]